MVTFAIGFVALGRYFPPWVDAADHPQNVPQICRDHAVCSRPAGGALPPTRSPWFVHA
jgi:hypothetical protein